jgi:hypothetical protein
VKRPIWVIWSCLWAAAWVAVGVYLMPLGYFLAAGSVVLAFAVPVGKQSSQHRE